MSEKTERNKLKGLIETCIIIVMLVLSMIAFGYGWYLLWTGGMNVQR